MTAKLEGLRVVARHGRRLRGKQQLRRVEVVGPTSARVVAALKAASAGRPGRADEQRWIEQIEQMRHTLGSSTEPLEIVDFGAGKASDFGTESRTMQTGVRTLGQMTASSKPPEWAYLLFRLIRELQPGTCLEMGACVGISAAYQSAALTLNGNGRLLTLEGSDVLAARSEQTLRELGLADRAQVRLGAFADTLTESLQELRPLEWAFIDGHHDEAATLEYMEQIIPALAPEAVLMFDDINWSPGMASAWRTIAADPRFALTVDLRSMGLAVVSEHAEPQRSLAVSYY